MRPKAARAASVCVKRLTDAHRMSDEDRIRQSLKSISSKGASSRVADTVNPRRFAAPLAIASLGLALFLPGITWGLPGTSSWSQDTIAAYRTIGAVEGWPDQWKGRYPPLHYLLLRAAYEPVLTYWEHTGQRVVDPQTGRMVLKPPHAPKVGLLILIARAFTVVMAIATGLGLWAATRRLTCDDTAALAAALALMGGAAFTYFAHLGNVDIPALCWFAWSVYFYARAVQSSSWTSCLWLGLFASLAACTKDAVAAVYPGMAIVLLVAETSRRRLTQPRWRALTSAVLQPRWLVGLAAFALPYLVINGVLDNPGGYLARIRYWVAPASDSVLAGEYRYPNQLRLLLGTLHFAAGGVGWPMLAVMVVSVIYALRRHVRLTLVMLLPAAVYYVSVIAQIRFVYARFLFPPIALVCVLVGVAVAAWLRRKDLTAEVRWGVPCLILVPTICYAVALDAEMLRDSRYAVEGWFVDNVEPSSEVGAFSRPQYLPRLGDLGYPTYLVAMTRDAFDRPQPRYLILTSYNYEDFSARQMACMKDLLSGQLGYQPVATFKGQYLGTGSSWLSLAGWGAPVPGKISPTVTVLRRAGH